MWGSFLDSQPPGVTAIMPFGDAKRLGYARRAVAAFLKQTYQHKQLVIANASGVPILERPCVGVRELTVPLHPTRWTVGALRNAALERADGQWILHWDDDDYAHQGLIAYCVAHRHPNQALLLNHQIRFNCLDSSAFMHVRTEGIPATIFYPRPADLAVRYADVDVYDTETFWIEHWGLRTVVQSNHQFPSNGLSVAIYHAHNVSPVEAFMVDRTGIEFTGQWELGQSEAGYLRNVLGSLDFRFNEVRPVEDDGLPEGEE